MIFEGMMTDNISVVLTDHGITYHVPIVFVLTQDDFCDLLHDNQSGRVLFKKQERGKEQNENKVS